MLNPNKFIAIDEGTIAIDFGIDPAQLPVLQFSAE
jgi:hypothetical protein